MKTKLIIFFIAVLSLFSFLAHAKNICKPIRSYRIDVISDILEDSLNWQKKLSKDYMEDSLSPFFIEKLFTLQPSEELMLSFTKNDVSKDYLPDASNILHFKYENNKFYIKRKEKSDYRKISTSHIESYNSFKITFDTLLKSGIIIIYKKDKKKSSISIPDFYLLSGRFAYLCKINLEDPFPLTVIHSPDSYPILAYIVGNVIFSFENNLYKLYVFKENSHKKGKLFIYYYETDSKMPKYVEVVKRRGSYFILDFNRAHYHYCKVNNNLSCPENMYIYSLVLPFRTGQK